MLYSKIYLLTFIHFSVFGQIIAMPNTNSKAIITNVATVIMVIKPENSWADNDRNNNIGICTKGDSIKNVHKSPG